MINRILSPTQDRSPAGSVVRDIKFLMEGFESTSLKHINRSLNIVAHKLAQCAQFVILLFLFTGILPRLNFVLMYFDQ